MEQPISGPLVAPPFTPRTTAKHCYTGFLRSCSSGSEAIPRMREYKYYEVVKM